MPPKKQSIKRQFKEAKKKVKGTGALLSEEEKQDLLGMTPTTKPKKIKKKIPKYMPK